MTNKAKIKVIKKSAQIEKKAVFQMSEKPETCHNSFIDHVQNLIVNRQKRINRNYVKALEFAGR